MFPLSAFQRTHARDGLQRTITAPLRWVIVACLLVSRVAHAHQTSVKYVDITIDGAVADVAFRLAPTDLTDLSTTAVAGWLELSSYGEPCTAGAPSQHAEDKLVAIS